ncbi:hypothetical protein [Methylobacterium sp. Leaf88]|nr:hypothetical protein [Methylobacterium sp. Leaf88]
MAGTMALECGARWEAEPGEHLVERGAGRKIGIDLSTPGVAAQ